MAPYLQFTSDSRLVTFSFLSMPEITGGDSIASATVTALPAGGLTLGTPTHSDSAVQVRVSGGASETVYQLTCVAVLTSGVILTGQGDLITVGPDALGLVPPTDTSPPILGTVAGTDYTYVLSAGILYRALVSNVLADTDQNIHSTHYIRWAANNVVMLKGNNAALSANIDVVKVNASNQVHIAPGGDPIFLGGTLLTQSSVAIGLSAPTTYPLNVRGSGGAGWQQIGNLESGAGADNSGTLMEYGPSGQSYGARLYAGRWSSTDRGARLVGVSSAGAENAELRLNAESSAVSLAKGGSEFVRVDSAGISLGTTTAQKVGFFGVTPVVQPAANPDTSGATLPQLEAEVNELKAMLRTVGLLA